MENGDVGNYENGSGGLEMKRSSWTKWTQDDMNLSYILNPRSINTKVSDNVSTIKTETDYRLIPNTNIAEYGLVSSVKVYDNNQMMLKKAETDYNLGADYISRRIIGLPLEKRTYGIENSAWVLASKTTFDYDGENFAQESNQNIPSVIRHDNSNFSASFITGRGNLTAATRWNLDFSTNPAQAITSKIRYDIAGSIVAHIDPLNRKTRMEYADAFNDTTVNRNTFAYPTKVYDAANNLSEVKYRFDTGANVWGKSPAPAENTTGKVTTRLYDAIGRLEKETLVNTGAYTRYEYPVNAIQAKVYSTVTDTNGNGADAADEVLSESWSDGAGRVLRSRTEHPNSTGGWTGGLTEYDILGQVKRSTVPTEINSNYDAARGFLWSQTDYDWKGRTIREINTDNTNRLMSYEGCGCAGGEIVTVESEQLTEGRRNKKSTRTFWGDNIRLKFSIGTERFIRRTL